MALGVFIVALMAGPSLILSLPERAESLGRFVLFLWLGGALVLPIVVYRRVRLPVDDSRQVASTFDDHINRINEQIAANRAILDKLPE